MLGLMIAKIIIGVAVKAALVVLFWLFFLKNYRPSHSTGHSVVFEVNVFVRRLLPITGCVLTLAMLVGCVWISIDNSKPQSSQITVFFVALFIGYVYYRATRQALVIYEIENMDTLIVRSGKKVTASKLHSITVVGERNDGLEIIDEFGERILIPALVNDYNKLKGIILKRGTDMKDASKP